MSEFGATRPPAPADGRVRLDKWLWAARLFKTRALAKAEIEAGHVRCGGERTRPSHMVSLGNVLQVRQGHDDMELVVEGLSDKRTAALLARTLYSETDSSRERREHNAIERRAANAVISESRPTKRQRRLIHRFKRNWDG